MVKSLVITGYGINCDKELAHAYELVGADVKIVHLKDILDGEVSIHDFHILNFPGGFSFGDDLGAGKALAQRIKHARSGKFMNEIKKFIRDGKYVLGVCNGFQVMVKLGLLPGMNDVYDEQSVTLWVNDSGKFEDRWVHVKFDSKKSNPFLKGVDRMYLPVRHGEGKLIYPEGCGIKPYIAGQYCDASGKIAIDYPENPNGSFDSIAALSDSTGRVFGLMPHPEAHLYFYNNPQWTRMDKKSEEGEGLKIFRNVVNHAKEAGF